MCKQRWACAFILGALSLFVHRIALGYCVSILAIRNQHNSACPCLCRFLTKMLPVLFTGSFLGNRSVEEPSGTLFRLRLLTVVGRRINNPATLTLIYLAQCLVVQGWRPGSGAHFQDIPRHLEAQVDPSPLSVTNMAVVFRLQLIFYDMVPEKSVVLHLIYS